MYFSFRLIVVFCALQSFLFGEDWNTVYLASFPRSGNHWVRFLVEEATHIATSSVYRDKDFPHLPDTFPWGGYSTDHGYGGDCRYPTGSDPVLLKTHYPFFLKSVEPEPKLAICLVRHPIDSFWSFNVYKNKKETTKIKRERIEELIKGWKAFYEYWLNHQEVLFVRYEDLHANTEFYLDLILKTAGFSFTQVDLERAVRKYSPEGKPLKHIEHYDAEAIEMIRTELADLLAVFNYEI